jgi:hypothetical protein
MGLELEKTHVIEEHLILPFGEAESTTFRCPSKLNEVGSDENPDVPPFLIMEKKQ